MNTNLTTEDLFPTRFIKSSDIGEEDIMLTMDELRIEELGDGDNSVDKPVLYFTEIQKGLVLNKTNCNTIEGMYGKILSEWQGKRITLYVTEVSYRGETHMGIRIRKDPPPDPSKLHQPVSQPENWPK